MSNPIRFGQEFQGKVANPRDILIFHRTKRSAARRAIKLDEVVTSIDDPEMSTSEKLARVRVETLVREYLQSQEMQILGDLGMSDAIQTFVEKDDSHAIQTCVVSFFLLHVNRSDNNASTEVTSLTALNRL